MPYRIKPHRPGGQPTEQQRHAEYKRARDDKETQAFYCSPRWRALRSAVLAERPLCEPCRHGGRTTPASVLDHKQEVKDRLDLALDPENLTAMCVSCHNAKTAKGVNERRGRGGRNP